MLCKFEESFPVIIKCKSMHVVSLEPDDFPKEIYLNGTRIGKDFRILHKLLTQYNFTNFTFVGPDSGGVRSQHGLFSESVSLSSWSFIYLHKE